MLALNGCELRPYHVVFSESIGFLLEESLARCKGAWLTMVVPVQSKGCNESKEGNISHEDAVEQDPLGDEDVTDVRDPKSTLHYHDYWEVFVQRTFVCVADRHAMLELPLTASTTDAHCSSSANPRKRIKGCATA